jgi:F-type H+-transporting ATPase subunit delta
MDPPTTFEELQTFESALSASSELHNVLLSPAVPPARKRAVVARLSEMLGTSRLVRNFFYVVIDHRRTALLADIRQAFQELVDQHLGVVEAEVRSARELTQEQRGSVSTELARLTGKKVRCRFSTEEGLIGGVVARIGSTIYDGSVRGQLESLRQRLVQ